MWDEKKQLRCGVSAAFVQTKEKATQNEWLGGGH